MILSCLFSVLDHWGLEIGYLLKEAELPRRPGGNMIGHIGENAIVRWDWYLYGNGGYDKDNRCSQMDLYIGGHNESYNRLQYVTGLLFINLAGMLYTSSATRRTYRAR